MRLVVLCVRVSIVTSLGGDVHSYERLLVCFVIFICLMLFVVLGQRRFIFNE